MGSRVFIIGLLFFSKIAYSATELKFTITNKCYILGDRLGYVAYLTDKTTFNGERVIGHSIATLECKAKICKLHEMGGENSINAKTFYSMDCNLISSAKTSFEVMCGLTSTRVDLKKKTIEFSKDRGAKSDGVCEEVIY